jgi:hypothetical protein
LGAEWPHTRWRLLWTWAFTWLFKRKYCQPYKLSDEWGFGHHLPSLVRLHYGTHVYTRWVVPIDADTCRLFYFHATCPSNTLGRAYERVHFTLFHNRLTNKNFSEQDAPGAIDAYPDAPEISRRLPPLHDGDPGPTTARVSVSHGRESAQRGIAFSRNASSSVLMTT